MPHTHSGADGTRPSRRAREGRRARRPPAGRPAPPARWLAAALLMASVAAGPLALGPPALGQQGEQARAAGPVSVFIDSVSPQWAQPGQSVTVTGTVRDNAAVAQDGLSVQLRSSSTTLYTEDDLSLYAAGEYPVDTPEGLPVPLPTVIPPGHSVQWQVTLSPAAAGLAGFGVYPLAAQVLNGAGVPVATDRTFLPYWPGGAASQLPRRLSIAWIWPLLAPPAQASCRALLSTSLAGNLASGGRLEKLLAAGAAYSAAAHVTWAIDPALVRSAAAMSHAYAVRVRADCDGTSPRPADMAARNWLAGLTAATAGQQVFLTPYADVDVAALSHNGLDADLRNAFTEGRLVGSQILHLPAGADTIAWPPGGLADAGVLGSLAINKISTVVLDSTVMPPSGALPNYTPSAQTSANSGVGSSMHVLLADHTMSQILAAKPALGAGPGAAFATEQRFLAQTAMIVAELPNTARSLVVAPPRLWNPAPGLASGLLSETVHAPWLRPASLASLAAVARPSGQVPRHSPPAHHVGRSELSRAYLGQVAKLDGAIKLQASTFSPSYPSYMNPAVAALESADWPGGRARATAARQALLKQVSEFVTEQGKKISIIDTGQITLGGSSGRVPVSISNGLHTAVRVRLRATVPAGDRLRIGPFDATVTIPAGNATTIRLPLRTSTVGVTEVTLGLLNPAGIALPGTTVQLPVHATRFGTLSLVILSAALGLFVLTSAARAVRRSRREGGQHGTETSDPPGPPPGTGSVGSGEDLANDDPPEDPDEYADAWGRARR